MVSERATPDALLDIEKAASGTSFISHLQVGQTGTVANSKYGIDFKNTTHGWNQGRISLERQGSASNFDMVLSSAGAGSLVEGIRIDHTGNVGIGTTDPDGFKTKITSAAKGLFVQSGSGGYTSFGFSGDAGTTKGSITSTSGRLYFGSENTGGTGSNGEFLVTPGTGNVMTLHGPTGHVGIGLGATTPSARLHVLGSSTTEGSIVIFDNAGSPNVNTGNDILFKYSDDNTQVDGNEVSIGGITAKATYASGAYSPIAAAIRVVPSAPWTSTSNPTYWAFSTTPAAATVMEERMRIDAAGNVGIGEIVPQTKLHVKSGDSGGTVYNAGYNPIVIETPSHGGLQILTPNNRNGLIYFGDNNNAVSGRIEYEHANDAMIFVTAGTERMRISSGGIITRPYQPAFHAYGLSNNINTVGTTFKFATVTGARGFNTGGHYSTTTGRFTAPVTGTYQFSWSSIGNATSGIFRMYLKKNNIQQGDMHLRLDGNATGSEYPDNAMYTITYKLVKDDYIEIFNGDGTNWYSGTGGANNDYYRFMGHLIG